MKERLQGEQDDVPCEWVHRNGCADRLVGLVGKVCPLPRRQFVVVCWFLNVPATCKCISGTDLLRQSYVLPHWDRSYRSHFPPHPVTVYWHRARPVPVLAVYRQVPGRVATGVSILKSLVWLDSEKKSRRKGEFLSLQESCSVVANHNAVFRMTRWPIALTSVSAAQGRKWEVTDCPARVLLIWNGIARGPVQSCNVCREHCDLDCNLW